MATDNAPLGMEKTTAEKRRERPHWVLDDAVYSISALLLCVILCMWSLLLLVRQAQDTRLARQLLDRDYVKIGDGQVVLPEDARVYSRPLEQLPKSEQDGFLPRLLMVAYNRFGATRSVQDAAEAVRTECEFETASMDTKLSMVRFTAWAIPAVGFVGTVR